MAEEAIAGGADWIEARHAPHQERGSKRRARLRRRFPNHVIIADMKTMDAGRAEVEAAAKAGANIIDVLGAASDATVRECVDAANNYGAEIVVDLIEVRDPAERARAAEAAGAHYIAVHTAIDVQMHGGDPFERLKVVANSVNIPVAVAGGINSETAARAVKNGAEHHHRGRRHHQEQGRHPGDPGDQAGHAHRRSGRTDLYRRVNLENVRDVLERVSTANISDAMHRASGPWRASCPSGPASTW